VSPLVSAIVLTTWTPGYAVRCVAALRGQTIADQIEIIVVENHSQDDSIGILRTRLKDIPTVRLIETPENHGYGWGNNFGATYATGKYILIINPDNEPEPNAIEKMVAMMEADPSIGILAPRLQYGDGTVRQSSRSFPTILDVIIKRIPLLQPFFKQRIARYLQSGVTSLEPRDTDWVVGAVLMLQLDFYRELKGFDERFFLFFEDMDLSRRTLKVGKRVVYAPRITVRDRKDRLSGESFLSILLKKTGRIHIASAVKYFWKWRAEV